MKDNMKLFLFIIFLGLILFHPLMLNKIMMTDNNDNNLNNKNKYTTFETAYFAGGCFWCMEPVFDVIEGVLDTTVGYMGGSEDTANYQDVSSGRTNHFEAIEVKYDPNKVQYKTLLDAFWRSIDPTDEDGQFADKGRHYETAIFIKSEKDRIIIDKSIEDLLKIKTYENPIATKILPVSSFYKAEDYHQNYYQKKLISI